LKSFLPFDPFLETTAFATTSGSVKVFTPPSLVTLAAISLLAVILLVAFL